MYCNQHKMEFNAIEKRRRIDFYRRYSLRNRVKGESTLPESILQNTTDNDNSDQVQLTEDTSIVDR